MIPTACPTRGPSAERGGHERVGALARFVVMDHGGDHHLVGLGLGGERQQPLRHRRGRADEHARAVFHDPCTVGV